MQIIFQILILYLKAGENFFDGLSDDEKLIYEDLNGPSWSPEKKNKKTKTSLKKKKLKNFKDLNLKFS